MPKEPRLHKKIAALDTEWELLLEKLSRLKQEKILETKTEEIFRLENKIHAATTELQQIEQLLFNLENQLSPEKDIASLEKKITEISAEHQQVEQELSNLERINGSVPYHPQGANSLQSSKSMNKSGDGFFRLKEDYERAISAQYQDPEGSLWRARKIAENICRQIYAQEISPPPEKLMLGKAISELQKAKVAPSYIIVPLQTIQQYGNLGAHDQGKESNYITPEYAQSCLLSLATVFDWYVETYHSEETEKASAIEKSVCVFICYFYQEPDLSLARDFEKALKQAGHKVFIDAVGRLGTAGAMEIRKALEKSDYFLLLLSPEAAASEMVLEEVIITKHRAEMRNGVPVILPVCIRQPLSYPLSYYLEETHQKAWNTSEDTSRLVDSLLTAIIERTDWTADTAETFPAEIQYLPSQPHSDLREPEIPGGAIKVDSYFYIKRRVDEEVFRSVNRSRAVVTVRGGRKIGKTSLVMQVCTALRHPRNRLRVAFVDFQAIPHKHFQSLGAIWKTITGRIAKQLQVREWKTSSWDRDVEYDGNISRFFETFIFQEDDTPVLLCFDEAERVFTTPVSSDFFASVRSFYNAGAMDPLWKNIRWLLATSSEPGFFIQDLNQSPFNIGVRVELGPFTPEEVSTFADRHGLSLARNDVDNIMEYVGGQPYLVHLLLYHLTHHPESVKQLFDARTAGDGVFRDHLQRYLMQFQQEKDLAEAMKNIISGKGCQDLRIANRLEAAGLVNLNKQREFVPFCKLYKEFFRGELK